MGRIGGKIYAIALLLLMAAGECLVVYFAWTKAGTGVAATAYAIGGFLLAIILASTVHELGHIVFAKAQGMRVVMTKFSFFSFWEDNGKMRFSFVSQMCIRDRDQEGRARVLWAALRAGLDKLRGIHGTFYRLLGPEVRGLDGFYGEDIPAYADLGIRIPTEPDLLCDQVYEKTGVQSYIVDANGLGVELMGKSSGITAPETWLTEVIRDNPAGQEEQMTPFILVRRLRDVG